MTTDRPSRLRDAALPIAFAASLAVHVSTFVAIVGADGGLRPTSLPSVPQAVPILEARLVATPARAAAEPALPPAGSERIAPPSPPEASPTEPKVAKALPGAAAGERSPVGWKPRVVVTERVPNARFGDALDGETLSGFKAEIDAPPLLPPRFEVAYPAAALAARKEGSVLAWAVIDDQGAVDSVHVVEGDPDFAEAVDAALRASRFVPARNLGVNIPHYITLEFEFRLGTSGGTVTAERAAAAVR